MESTEGNPKRFKMADAKADIPVLKEQLSQLMRVTPIEEDEIETCKALSEEYVSKLSEEMFESDPIVIQIMKKLGMYSHKEKNQPLEEFNTWFQDNLKNSPSWKDEPIENFTLSLTGVPICSPELETFHKQCAPYIKSLELQIADLVTKKQWSKGAPQFFKTVRMLLENVKILHLKLEDRKDDPAYMTTADISEQIFSAGLCLSKCEALKLTLTRSIDFAIFEKLPALQEFVLRVVDNVSGPGEFPNLFAHLSGIRSINIKANPEFLNLKILDLIGVPKASLRSLVLANFVRLEDLALSLSCLVTEDELGVCLKDCIHNLKSLELLRGKTIAFAPFKRLPFPEELENDMSFPEELENLYELELWGNVVTNLEFLRSTPYLKRLRMDFCCFDCPYYSGNVNDVPNVFQGNIFENSPGLGVRRIKFFPHIQELVIDCKLSLYAWGILRRWMPNLRRLEAPINGAELLDLCDCLKKLEVLRLRFGSEVDDNGIVAEPVIDQWGRMTEPRGITKLKNLCTFELEVECGRGKLTDKSAELGFLKLEHLDTLKLGFTGSMLTIAMEMRLRVKIEHVEMYRSCSKTTEGEKVQRCCQWADFKRDWRLD